MIVVHHNPACGTSRNVLQVIRDAGYDPVVIDYLEEGWTRPQLQALFAAADLPPPVRRCARQNHQLRS